MRELGLPPLVESLKVGGLADALFENAERTPDLPQFSRRADLGSTEWSPVTAAEFRDEVMAVAKGLLANGIRFGDRVAADVPYPLRVDGSSATPLWSIGAEIVPVYPTSSAEQVRWILNDAGGGAIVVEHEDQAMTVGAACDGLPAAPIWQMDLGCVDELTERRAAASRTTLVHRHRAAVQPDGRRHHLHLGHHRDAQGLRDHPRQPRGRVRHPARRLGRHPRRARRAAVHPRLPSPVPHLRPDGRRSPACAAASGSATSPTCTPETLLPALASFRPTFLFAVPYVFEKIYHRARAHRRGARAGSSLFDKAADVAVRYAEAIERHAPWARARAEPVAQGPARRSTTARCTADAGRAGRPRPLRGVAAAPRSTGTGAVLRGRRHHRLRRVRPHRDRGRRHRAAAGTVRFGTVGRPLPGCAVHIAEDGEVWVRGDHGLRRLPQRPQGHRGGAAGRLVRHRRHRASRRRGLSRHHRAQEGHHHHQRRQERGARCPWRSGCARTRWSRSAWSWATTGRTSRRPDHPGPGGRRPLAGAAGQAAPGRAARWRTTRNCARRSSGRC